MTVAACPVCGAPTDNVVCHDCVNDFAETIRQKRYHMANDAMKKLDKEAGEVFEEDPTKGRGRGPKWVNG